MGDEVKPAKRKVWTVYGVVALVLLLALISTMFSGSANLRAARCANAANEINQITTACLGYYTEYGQLPASSENHRLFESLARDNPRKIPFIMLKPTQLNSNGEMIDIWGTPFRITFGPDSKVLVISAGPDRIFGTADDIMGQ